MLIYKGGRNGKIKIRPRTFCGGSAVIAYCMRRGGSGNWGLWEKAVFLRLTSVVWLRNEGTSFPFCDNNKFRATLSQIFHSKRTTSGDFRYYSARCTLAPRAGYTRNACKERSMLQTPPPPSPFHHSQLSKVLGVWPRIDEVKIKPISRCRYVFTYRLHRKSVSSWHFKQYLLIYKQYKILTEDFSVI